MKKALNYLVDLIDNGMDYPDALYKASDKFHVAHDILAEAYDNFA